MIINHTSPNKIETIKRTGFNQHMPEIEFTGCLFFSDDIYQMTASSTVHHYTLNLEESACISVEDLEDVKIDDKTATEMILNFAEDLDIDVDEDQALDMLIDDAFAHDLFDHENTSFLSWYVQGIQGRVARKMGFTACLAEDEQGPVYIVDMYKSESLLTYEGTL